MSKGQRNSKNTYVDSGIPEYDAYRKNEISIRYEPIDLTPVYLSAKHKTESVLTKWEDIFHQHEIAHRGIFIPKPPERKKTTVEETKLEVKPKPPPRKKSSINPEKFNNRLFDHFPFRSGNQGYDSLKKCI
jgi:hypothetical protein